MLRFIKNLMLWLMVLVLFCTLYYVLYPQRVQLLLNPVQPQATQFTSKEDQISALMKQRTQLEEEKAALEKEIRDATKAPSSVFVVFTVMDETTIQSAAQVMDLQQFPGVMTLSQEDLTAWNGSVPSFVHERLQKGWEICLNTEGSDALTLQNTLCNLALPEARMAFAASDNAMTSQSGVLLILDLANAPASTDEMWHIPAMGNMNQEALRIYEASKHAGSAIAFLVGGHQADQRYSKDNLLALMELVQEDAADQAMQCIPAREAYLQYQNRQAVIDLLQPDWDARKLALEEQLNALTKQITRVTE